LPVILTPKRQIRHSFGPIRQNVVAIEAVSEFEDT
jgi:hypothetical protein